MTKAGRKIRNIKPRGWDQTLIGDNVTFLQTPKTLFFHFTAKKVAFLSERKLSLRKLYFTEEKFTLRRESELSLRKVHFPLEKCTFPP